MSGHDTNKAQPKISKTFWWQAESEEKMVEVVAETMVTLGGWANGWWKAVFLEVCLTPVDGKKRWNGPQNRCQFWVWKSYPSYLGTIPVRNELTHGPFVAFDGGERCDQHSGSGTSQCGAPEVQPSCFMGWCETNKLLGQFITSMTTTSKSWSVYISKIYVLEAHVLKDVGCAEVWRQERCMEISLPWALIDASQRRWINEKMNMGQVGLGRDSPQKDETSRVLVVWSWSTKQLFE